MLTMPSIVGLKDQLPEQLRERTAQLEELMFTLIACCNEASPQTDPDVVLNALLSVYCLAVQQTGLFQIASDVLSKASMALAVEAAQRSAPAASTTPSNLH